MPVPPIWIGAGDTCTSGSYLRRKTLRQTCCDVASFFHPLDTRSALVREVASRFDRTEIASSAGRRWNGSTVVCQQICVHTAQALHTHLLVRDTVGTNRKRRAGHVHTTLIVLDILILSGQCRNKAIDESVGMILLLSVLFSTVLVGSCRRQSRSSTWNRLLWQRIDQSSVTTQ